MSARLEAVPTEYKGVVYRSKCEAMFARWIELELIGNEKHDCFHYEPEYLRFEDWVPDFSVLRFCKNHPFYPNAFLDYMPRVEFEVVEYKPTSPTKTYVKRLLSRFKNLRDEMVKRHGYLIYLQMTFHLYVGSVWSDKSEHFVVVNTNDEEWEFFETSWDWIADHADAIKSTRFDLEANHA